jgi:hypothetical protein
VQKKRIRKAEPSSKRGIAWPRWTGIRGMTVRDWLQLLILPFTLVVIGFLFTMQQDARQQRIENQRAEAERNLAEQRAQDEVLQAFLDQMGSLLLRASQAPGRVSFSVIDPHHTANLGLLVDRFSQLFELYGLPGRYLRNLPTHELTTGIRENNHSSGLSPTLQGDSE